MQSDTGKETNAHGRPHHHSGTLPWTSWTDGDGDGIGSFAYRYPFPAFSPAPDATALAPTGHATETAAADAANPASSSALAGIVPASADQATSAGGGPFGGSGGTSGSTQSQSHDSSGLVIIANYDSSITALETSSPTLYTELTGAISAAIQFYESEITNPITITIDFGFGEVDGTALGSSDLGESEANYQDVSYDSMVAALKSHATSAADQSAVATLPSSDPTDGGSWYIADSEAAALGLLHGPNGVDGYVGLSDTSPLTYDPNDRAVSGDYDAIGVLEHEISEVMGRVQSLGTYLGSNDYTPLDLFRYAAPGIRDLSPGPGYFSINNGTTNLDTFNNPTNGGDAADWSTSVTHDSFDAYSSSGVANTVSTTDLTVMNVLGYDIACYLAGTRILTAQGEVPVEGLAAGDRVCTRFAGLVPVKWVGQRRIDCGRHPNPRQVWPVRVCAHAFGEGMPHRDLWLSPDHAVLVGDLLIPIRLLVNGATIVQDRRPRHVHYFHVELAHHDILLAEGLPAESYLDTGNRGLFANGDEPLLLHPRLAEPADHLRRDAERDAERGTACCAPLAGRADQIEPVWQRLATRAAAMGHTVSLPASVTEPQLRLSAGGREIQPVRNAGNRYVFILPAQTETVQIVSRAGAPSDLRPWLDDRRRLGVAVSRVSLCSEAETRDFPVDHPSVVDGWHGVERDGEHHWRWTNGNARLPVPDGTRMVEIHLARSSEYPAEATVPAWALAG